MTGPGNQPLPLLELYQVLLSHNGCQNWWPAQTRDEVIVGAILTQSVAWGNVEKALVALAGQGILTLRDIHLADLQLLATLVRPTLYYNQKALRLKEFARFLGDTCGFDLDILFSEEPSFLRARMLSIKGLGPETVDSILLYAGGLPVFVVDAYTKRLLSRLGYPVEKLDYHQLQDYICARIPAEVPLYNDFHAQIVLHCKDFCKKAPLCPDCPLRAVCPSKTS
ncbi:MAG: endonuclease III domain-containing protein [Candidatus Cloacimonetes bacterium]|nr:endonuclease III domain-containing protein [Candidatus Cloacimonadota bacterium]